MYIPKLRNPEKIVDYFKHYDNDTAVTIHLFKTLAKRKKVICRFIGKKRLFNLDECLQYFTGTVRYEKTKRNKGLRKMRGTFEILGMFKEYDPDTILCKLTVRKIASDEKKVFARFHNRTWMIDLEQFIAFFSGKTNQAETKVPRIRYYEKSYHLIRQLYPQYTVTWNQLYSIVHSGDIFVLAHGKRWLLNFDQLVENISSNPIYLR